jgi:putative ABC transport system permease protein
VQYELSYDNFFEKGENIYRLAMERTSPDKVRNWGWTSVLDARSMVQDYPEVLERVRILTEMGETQIKHEDNQFIENKVMYADSNFYNLFSISLIEGDPKYALMNPNSVVISKSTAQRYFGNDNPMGKAIIVRNWWADNAAHVVTGISEDVPHNAHFHYDFLMPISSTRVGQSQNRGYWQVFNYLLLEENCNPYEFEAKLPDFIEKYYAPMIEEDGSRTFEEYLALGNGYKYFLQPMKDIHLRSNLEHEIEQNNSITYISIFTVSALFILLIACINFMNLSTARSLGRAKEVGVRKTVGSFRRQLINQFLFESVFMSLISLAAAIGMVELFLPAFRSFTGNELFMPYFSSVFVIPGLFAFSILIGLLSGCYPAFYLSSFKPVSVLKGKLRAGFRRKSVRNIMVIVQFGASIALISGTIIVKNQIDYMLGLDLGYNESSVIVLSNGASIEPKYSTFKNELLMNSNVIGVTSSGSYPARALHVANFRLAGPDSVRSTSLFNMGVGYDFFKTMEMEITKGRAFRVDIASDSAAVIISETASQILGLSEPLGEKFHGWSTPFYTIIGVVKDFHFRSLHYDIGPLVIFNARNRSRFVSIRVHSDQIPSTLGFIRDQWNKFSGGAPFNYTFLDKENEILYRSEIKTKQITTVFSIISIFVGALGLFGLAAYAAEQRIKEIGIRKVLGASGANIFILMSKEFIKLILIAFVCAVPIVYYLTSNWLQNFAYRTDISALSFLVSGFLTILIALITVSSQILRAVHTNPVDSLKYE